MLYSLTEHGMTPFHFQNAQKNSASLRSSVWQLKTEMKSYHALQLKKACFPVFQL